MATHSTLRGASKTLASTEWLSSNPYLTGVFAPVRSEISADDLPVIGRLPQDMDGMFIRNGPNPQFTPRANYHLFDGDGMLHGVTIRGGRAGYLNRYVRTESWKQERAAGRCLGAGMYDGACAVAKNLYTALRRGNFDFANKANTSLVWHHGKLLALWEGGTPYEIRSADLETIGPETFGGRWTYPFTAHPKVDAATGEMLFFGYSLISRDIQYGVLHADGRVAHTTSIQLPRPVMMHDFAISQRYTIFMDLPLTASLWRTIWGKSVHEYQPQFGARFGILPRYGQGTDIRWFAVQCCYVFHVLNAYEVGDEVVVHGCRYPHAPQVVSSKHRPLVDPLLDAVMYCWRFNLRTGESREGPLDDQTVEFPRVDDALVGTQARYGYATSLGLHTSAFVKYDLENGGSVRHELGPSRVAGEGVFIPRQNRCQEDDGHLVALVHDQREHQSELVMVDCRDFQRLPIARILMPQRVPVGFHGVWLNRDAAGSIRP